MSTHEEVVKKSLGRLIRAAYKDKGETRQSAAEAIGISAKTLYSLEVGDTKARASTRAALEDYLGWRRGSITDLLQSGPNVDLEAVTLRSMSAVPSAEWMAAAPAGVDETARRIQEDARALSNRLKERDRTIESLEAELKQGRERIDKLQEDLHHALEALRVEQRRSEVLVNEFDLAGDSSSDEGAELRAALGEVGGGSRNV